MSKSFDELRQLHKEFIYRGYSIQRMPGADAGACDIYHIEYDMEISGLSSFTAKWDFPVTAAGSSVSAREGEDLTDDPIFNALVFNLGLVECISYYKIACPKRFVIRCGSLSADRIGWWRKLIYNGLGEFMYRNGIDVTEEELVDITCNPDAEKMTASDSAQALSAVMSGADTAPLFHDTHTYSGCLTPVGGGKDSVVSLELLKDKDIITYTVNGNDTTRAVIDVCNHKTGDYVASRRLDRRMLDLNAQGYLNGHTPFSAIVAFSSVIAAYILGRKYITLSNESSANETTVRDSFVNHQYSKSYEFECDFNGYMRGITDSDIRYFSMLRPLSEMQIAALFAGYRQYHKVFRSCNAGSKQGIWCCNCPKCLFVYIILSPFLSEEALGDIFGEKLLDKESLDKDFRELIGIDENKPFECVGTRREVASAMKCYRTHGGRSLLTDRYADYIDGPSDADPVSILLTEWCDEHNVPEELAQIVRNAITAAAADYSLYIRRPV